MAVAANSVSYLFARQDDIVVGGTYEQNVDTPEADVDTCKALLARMERIFCGDINDCGLINPAPQCTRAEATP